MQATLASRGSVPRLPVGLRSGHGFASTQDSNACLWAIPHDRQRRRCARRTADETTVQWICNVAEDIHAMQRRLAVLRATHDGPQEKEVGMGAKGSMGVCRCP